jgi:hypothetical protein
VERRPRGLPGAALHGADLPRLPAL